MRSIPVARVVALLLMIGSYASAQSDVVQFLDCDSIQTAANANPSVPVTVSTANYTGAASGGVFNPSASRLVLVYNGCLWGNVSLVLNFSSFSPVTVRFTNVKANGGGFWASLDSKAEASAFIASSGSSAAPPSDGCMQGWFSIEMQNTTWLNATSVASFTTPPISAGSSPGENNVSCVSIRITDSAVGAAESIATIAADSSGGNAGLGSHIRGGRISILRANLTLSDRYKPSASVAQTFPAYIFGVIGTTFLGLGTVVGGRLLTDLQVTVTDSNLFVEATSSGVGAAALSWLVPPALGNVVRRSTLTLEASRPDSLTLNVASSAGEAVGASILSNNITDARFLLRVASSPPAQGGGPISGPQRPQSGIWVTGANRALAFSLSDSLAASPSVATMKDISITSEGKFVVYSKGASLLSASQGIVSRRDLLVDGWTIEAQGPDAEITAAGEFLGAALAVATLNGGSLTASRGTLTARFLTVNATSTFTGHPSIQYCAITIGVQAALHLTATDVTGTVSNVTSFSNAVDRAVAVGALSVLGNLQRIENWSFSVFLSTLTATSGSAGRTCYSVAAGFASHDDTWYNNVSVYVSDSMLRAVALEYASAVGFVSYSGTTLNGSFLVLAVKNSTVESRASGGSATSAGLCVTTAAILRNTTVYASNSTLTSFGFYYSSALAVMSSTQKIDCGDISITSSEGSSVRSENDPNQVNALAASVGVLSHDDLLVENASFFSSDSEVSALGSVRSTALGLCNYQGPITISSFTTVALRSKVLAKTLWNVNTLLSVVGVMSQNALKVTDVTMTAVNSSVQGISAYASAGSSVIAGSALGFSAYLSTVEADRVLALAVGSTITVLSVALGISANVAIPSISNLRVASCASTIQVISTSDGVQEIALGIYPPTCNTSISVVALATGITARRCLSVFGGPVFGDSVNSSLRYSTMSCGINIGSSNGGCGVPSSLFVSDLSLGGTILVVSTVFAGATFDPANELGPPYRVSGPTPNIALECPLFGQEDWVLGNKSTQFNPGFPNPSPGPLPPMPCATVTSPLACALRLGCQWDQPRVACLPKPCEGLNRTECNDNTWCSSGAGSDATATQNCSRINCAVLSATACVATSGCWLSNNPTAPASCTWLPCNGSNAAYCPSDCTWEAAASRCSSPVSLQPPTPAPTLTPPNVTAAPQNTSTPFSAAPSTAAQQSSPQPSPAPTDIPPTSTTAPSSSTPAPTTTAAPITTSAPLRSRTHSITLVSRMIRRDNPRLTSSSVGAVAQILGKDAAVATVASATTSTVVAGLVNPTVAMQAGRIIAIASVSNCIFADSDNTPSYFEHPIQVSFHDGDGGSSDFALYSGSTLLSVICFIVFPLLVMLAVWFAGTTRQTSHGNDNSARGVGGIVSDDPSLEQLEVNLIRGDAKGTAAKRSHAPQSRPLGILQSKVISTTSFLGLAYFGPSVFKSLFLVSWHSNASMDIAVVAISAAAVCFCVFLLLRAVLFRAPLEGLPNSEKSESDEMNNAVPGSMFIETFGGLFDAARCFPIRAHQAAANDSGSGAGPWFDRATRFYFFEEFLFSSCLQVLEGIRPTSGSCVPAATCMLVVCLAHLGFLLVVRPYRERIELVLSIIGAILLLALSGVCVALSNYSAASASVPLGSSSAPPAPPEALTKALGILSLADMIYFFLQALILGAVTLAAVHKKRLRHQWVTDPEGAEVGTELEAHSSPSSMMMLQVPEVKASATSPVTRYDPHPHQVNVNYNPLLAGSA